MNAPGWRLWLTVAQVCGWGMLTIRFLQKDNLPFALMCLLLFITNGVLLWRLNRARKDR